MEQKRKPRNKPMLTWSINVQQRRQEYTIRKRQSLQQIVLGKLDRYMQKTESEPLSYIIQKNKLKID